MTCLSRIHSIQPPIIQELQKQYTPRTLSLAQGVPFFPPPPEALEATVELLKDHTYRKEKGASLHTYGPDAGIQELREAVAGKFRRENGRGIEPGQVMITAGANQAFINAIITIAGAGDEVILLSPYYFNHEMALRMLGIVPRIVETDDAYQPVVERIRQAINVRTRAVVTISPNNPTGAVYSQRDLKMINDLCREHNIIHISDETYEYFTFGEEPHYTPGPADGSNTITLHSFSKAYGMAGWRVGYMTFPPEMHEDLLKVQDTVIICPSIASQLLALECLKIGKDYVNGFSEEMGISRQIMIEYLDTMGDQVHVPVTTGGYYLYPRISSEMTGMELTLKLIRKFDVCVVPGEPFGSFDGCYVRLSYGNVDPEKAEEGMKRFTRGLDSLLE